MRAKVVAPPSSEAGSPNSMLGNLTYRITPSLSSNTGSACATESCRTFLRAIRNVLDMFFNVQKVVSMTQEYLNDPYVADLLGMSVKALRNKVARGDPLPPFIQPPGMRVRLWPRDGFDEWMASHIAATEVAKPKSLSGLTSRRIGRPRGNASPQGGSK